MRVINFSFISKIINTAICSALLIVMLVSASSTVSLASTNTLNTGIYGVFEHQVINSNAYANPFDFDEIELQTSFTSPSGAVTNFFGFYDGDGQGGQFGDVWTMRFMPDEIGLWTYSYSWSDGTVGGNGSFQTIDSGLNGPIIKDPTNGIAWKYLNGDNFIPFLMQPPRYTEIDNPLTDAMLDFFKDSMGANGVTQIFRNRVWLDCEDSANCSPSSNLFSLDNWAKIDLMLDKLQQRGMSMNVMFYTDDAARPIFAGQSQKERLLFKYTIARIAAYSNLSFDSGIDIREFRSAIWSDWFALELQSLDPWDHFVGSRHGGGSGEFDCDECGYDARGEIHPSYTQLLAIMQNTPKPVINTERWREDFWRGNFNSESIRKIIWHSAMVGGSGFVIGGKNGYLRYSDFDTDIDEPGQLKTFSDFWHLTVKNWSEFVVCNEDASNANCFAEKGKTYVLYMENGNSASLDLSLETGTFLVQWLNPRTGDISSGSSVTAGAVVDFEAVDSNDWVVYIYDGSTTGNLTSVAITASNTQVNSGDTVTLSWSSLNTNNCEASGDWSGSRDISGSEISPPITASATFILNCTGDTGSSSASVTVGINNGGAISLGSGVIITDALVYDENNGTDWSIQNNLQITDTMYGDRGYSFTQIPMNLIGQEWLSTANDSRTFTDIQLVTFTVAQDADVFILHRDDIANKPGWLSDWADTNNDVINSEPRIYSVFSRNFSAGNTVSLGMNGNTGSGMYVVVVVPATPNTEQIFANGFEE